MIGSAPSKKRNPAMTILLPILTIVILAAACFAICEVLYLLNNAAAPAGT